MGGRQDVLIKYKMLSPFFFLIFPTFYFAIHLFANKLNTRAVVVIV